MATAIFYRQTMVMPRAQLEMRRSIRATMKLLDQSMLVLRPVLVTAAILIATAHWAAPHNVGPVDDPLTGPLNTAGPAVNSQAP